MASEEKLDEVLGSMKNNRVAIKGNYTLIYFLYNGISKPDNIYSGLILCSGKIHTPMEYKGELASYEMRLRYVFIYI